MSEPEFSIAANTGSHGGDGPHLAAALGVPVDQILDLSASFNPAADDPLPLLGRHLEALRHYPDDSPARLALASTLGVGADRVVITNGGAEAIALVAAAHPTGWAEQQDFSLYRRHLTNLDPDGPRWMSDPNNPTGQLANTDTHAFVRDEAFYVLATGRWTRGQSDGYVVGSLTKAFACPGLRIGYVIAPDEASAHQLEQRRPRWSVNSLIASALPEMLAGAKPQQWRKTIASLRAETDQVLGDHGLIASRSDTNYLWVPHAPGVRSALMPHGVLVRSGASFGHPNAIRVAVPNGSGIERLQAALRVSKVHLQ